MYDEEAEVLAHIGVARKSGRYPWGSGANPGQHGSKSFIEYVNALKKEGLSEKEIQQGMGMKSTEYRARMTIAKTEEKAARASEALRLKDKGLANTAIGERMGIPESSVRALLDPASIERNAILGNVSNVLKEVVDEKGALDIGEGVENHLGVSNTLLNTAVIKLEDEGYQRMYFKRPNVGAGGGKETTIKVLAAPGTDWKELNSNLDSIGTIHKFSEDGGRTVLGMLPPLNIDPKRVGVRYAEEGGSDMDGVIQVRPGVDDVSIGGSRYAQVRIGVGDGHYLKGMAIYSDDLPDGVDLMFNTNKSSTGNKLDAMKPVKRTPEGDVDPDNPFGSEIKRQIIKRDANGKETVTSAMNIVNEEGDWSRWSKKLSSQMLSKQTQSLAKEQLGLAYDIKKAEYDRIMELTNPAVRKRLLQTFSDSADSSSVHLKAASLPRTANHVILPIPSMKDTEIFAPGYKDGERVVLIRHPHGGRFEIPELTVNNRNQAARKSIGIGSVDAVGISPRVAARLSGADFDGDTVLVIPNNRGSVKTSPPLEALKGFDPQRSYPKYEGMSVMTPRGTQREMGGISNLITDMTIRKASEAEIARAVRHSMVVIDAEKHKLNYKQSAIDHNIKELKTKYQGGADKGASTLISRASAAIRVDEKGPGVIDKATGKLVYTPTGAGYTKPAYEKVSPKLGKVTQVPETFVKKQTKTTPMAETDDAHTLTSGVSGTPIENVYADHANKLKALANTARKSMVDTKSTPYSESARKVYEPEVARLKAALNTALMNKPRERQAQVIANATVAAKKAANPGMTEAEIKKLNSQALKAARERTGADKDLVVFEGREWEAVQAGAISNNMLDRILQNANLEQVKQLATPRENTVMTTPTLARAKSMQANGFTPAEIAEILGIPASTLNTALTREES